MKRLAVCAAVAWAGALSWGAAGCASAGGGGSLMGGLMKSAPPRKMGQGTRRTMTGTKQEAAPILLEEWGKMSDWSVSQGDDSVVATYSRGGVYMTMAVYFSPGPSADQLEAESIFNMPYVELAKLQEMEDKTLSGLADKIELQRFRSGKKPAAAPAANPAASPAATTAPEAKAPTPVPATEEPKPAPKPSKSYDSQL